MAKHLAPKTTGTPTQVVHPWKATARTVVGVAAGIILSIASIAASLAIFAPQFIEAVLPVLPETWKGYALATVAGILAFSGAVTRVMAIPGVNEWLKKISLGAGE